MHEPPADVADHEVLDLVRRHWLPDADEVRHLAVGFGAHHWAAASRGRRRLFVTLDRLGARHGAASLEGAYAGAAELARQGLEFVLAPVPSASGAFTVPLRGDAVSATPWREGTSGTGPHQDAEDAVASARRLARLHAAEVGPQVPRWSPLVPARLGDDLADLAARPWDDGPHGEPARAALLPALDRLAAWADRYHRLAAGTDPATWVPTHGEPHTRNLLRTADGDLVVDWESLKLAPRERDLSMLLASGSVWTASYPWPAGSTGPDAAAVELFDLEWRLDEIAQYATYLAGPHADDADARTSLGGLRHELERPPGPGAGA